MTTRLRALALGALALGAAALAGCRDVLSLDEQPVSFLAENQFFRTADDAVAATKAAYGSLGGNGYYARELVMQAEMRADYVDGRGSYFPAGNYQYDSPNIQRVGQVWTAIYQGVNRANLLIARVPGIAMPEAQRAGLVAEARFLRALNYYNLVRLWGAVPLRTEPVVDLTSLAAPRAAPDSVYGLVVQDLQFAEANLPDRWTGADIGRATRWAAKTLLADVYLTRGRYAEAAAKAREVLAVPRFSLVRVRAPNDFDQVYGPAVVESTEEIFFVKFANVNGLGSFLPAAIHHASAGYSAAGFRAVLGDVRAPLLAAWDTTDLRRSYNLYVGAETRFLSAAEPALFKKYRDPNGQGSGNGSGTDFPVLRYADALLISAEADALAGGPSPAAYAALNQVRRRAYGFDPGAPSRVDVAPGLSAAQFREAVLRERFYEFMLEAKRWFDLLRTGTAVAAITAVGEPIQPRDLLWPIPREELDNNDALTSADQNPGW